MKDSVSAPIATLATSPSLMSEPSGLVRSRIWRNWSGVRMRDWTLTMTFSRWPWTVGRPPSWPAATWAFWATIAFATSVTVICRFAILSGSSQIRMAYCEPNNWVSPTPVIRPTGS